jgi:hypothetical protein
LQPNEEFKEFATGLDHSEIFRTAVNVILQEKPITFLLALTKDATGAVQHPATTRTGTFLLIHREMTRLTGTDHLCLLMRSCAKLILFERKI